MSNQQHPITPPAELIKQWVSAFYDTPIVPGEFSIDIAIKAAQWGADMELEMCCEWLAYEGHEDEHLALRAARRPKPPSLKEQALEALQFVDEKLDLPLHNHCNAIHTIRRALEALPND